MQRVGGRLAQGSGRAAPLRFAADRRGEPAGAGWTAAENIPEAQFASARCVEMRLACIREALFAFVEIAGLLWAGIPEVLSAFAQRAGMRKAGIREALRLKDCI